MRALVLFTGTAQRRHRTGAGGVAVFERPGYRELAGLAPVIASATGGLQRRCSIIPARRIAQAAQVAFLLLCGGFLRWQRGNAARFFGSLQSIGLVDDFLFFKPPFFGFGSSLTLGFLALADFLGNLQTLFLGFAQQARLKFAATGSIRRALHRRRQRRNRLCRDGDGRRRCDFGHHNGFGNRFHLGSRGVRSSSRFGLDRNRLWLVAVQRHWRGRCHRHAGGFDRWRGRRGNDWCRCGCWRGNNLDLFNRRLTGFAEDTAALHLDLHRLGAAMAEALLHGTGAFSALDAELRSGPQGQFVVVAHNLA